VQNLVGIDTAVTDVRMREKHGLCGFFLLTYLSVYLSVRFFVGATGHSFEPIFTLNDSNDVVSQPLVLFDGHINIAPGNNLLYSRHLELLQNCLKSVE